MDLFDIFGWAAAALTLFTYSQKTMLPLRISAVSANICFIIWSMSYDIYPTLALHSALLPLNLYRLFEILRMKRRATEAREGGFSPLDWLRPLVEPVEFADGAYIFRKGDPPDRLYYLVSGSVVFDEVGRRAGPGELFGEVAFFTRQRERTASARCEGRCEVLALDDSDFTTLFLQNPAFNLYVVRVIAERLATDPVPVENTEPPLPSTAR